MNQAPETLAQLVTHYQIDVSQLFDYFNEAINREEQYLELTWNFSTPESQARTQDIIALLQKLNDGLIVFCLHKKWPSLPIRTTAVTDYMRQTNALKFLLLVKKFPLVLNEFIPKT